LDRPVDLVFDEKTYIADACRYLGRSASACIGEPALEVHPPMGKWLLAATGSLDPGSVWSYRLATAIAGVATVVLIYLIARKLFASILIPALAALLLATDLLHLVHSRLALLDAFVVLFGMGALLLVLIDSERAKERLARRVRPLRAAAGAVAGLAIASKWTGVFYLVTIVILAILWETASRRDTATNAFDLALREEGLDLVVSFLLVPLATYAITFVARVDGSFWSLPWTDGSWISAFWVQQADMYRYQTNFHLLEVYRSPAWSWPLLKRPMTYYIQASSHDVSRILAMGNPFVWWPALATLPVAAAGWASSRWKAVAEPTVVVGFAATYLVLIPLTLLRESWLSYLLPAVPFLCLALAYGVSRLGGAARSLAATAVVLAAILPLAYFWPLLTGSPLSKEQAAARLWFDACDAPGWRVPTTLPDGSRGTKLIRSFAVPRGWCWGDIRYVDPGADASGGGAVDFR
jgi:dolichyl-phosphate-mannose--protein O-mannosyl transferase